MVKIMNALVRIHVASSQVIGPLWPPKVRSVELSVPFPPVSVTLILLVMLGTIGIVAAVIFSQ